MQFTAFRVGGIACPVRLGGRHATQPTRLAAHVMTPNESGKAANRQSRLFTAERPQRVRTLGPSAGIQSGKGIGERREHSYCNGGGMNIARKVTRIPINRPMLECRKPNRNPKGLVRGTQKLGPLYDTFRTKANVRNAQQVRRRHALGHRLRTIPLIRCGRLFELGHSADGWRLTA